MILRTEKRGASGIFGTLLSDRDEEICKTLEHAYLSADGTYKPKIPRGFNFACVRGLHRLPGGYPFDTFEVTGVDGHSGILFHAGNFNSDSSGCILVGEDVWNEQLLRSRTAFMSFMTLLNGVESFVLTVIGG